MIPHRECFGLVCEHYLSCYGNRYSTKNVALNFSVCSFPCIMSMFLFYSYPLRFRYLSKWKLNLVDFQYSLELPLDTILHLYFINLLYLCSFCQLILTPHSYSWMYEPATARSKAEVSPKGHLQGHLKDSGIVLTLYKDFLCLHVVLLAAFVLGYKWYSLS